MTNSELVTKLNNGEYITAEEWLSVGELSKETVEAVYERKIRQNAKQWGEDYIYTRWARESKVKALEAYDRGEVVYIDIIDRQYDNGYTTETELYSDGRIKCAQYYDGD